MPKKTTITRQQKKDFEAKRLTVSFTEFYAIYAALEKFNHIPDIHIEMIDFLSSYKEWSHNTGVLMAFRNSAKSSISAALIVWLLVRDPSLLLLVQSADDTTAQKTIADCQKIINIHPMAAHLKGDQCVWTARGFRVKGATSGRNLSVAARGIFSNITGHRADIIIFDDIEAPGNVGTAELRDKLRSRVSEAFHLLNPQGTRLFIGTPHSWDSLYPEIVDKGASFIRIPLINNMSGAFPHFVGDSSWPERWPQEEIVAKQLACKTRAEFLSQYQLMPSSTEECSLDPALLKTYKAEAEFIESNGTKNIRIGDKYMNAVACFWDPAMSKATGDASVVSITFGDKDGNIYLHRVVEMIGDAEQQCEQVKALLLNQHIPLIQIETNGVGAFLPQLLLGKTRGLNIAVDGKATREKKTESIIKAFETPLSGGFLYVHESVMGTKFVQQLRDFNPKFFKGRNDFIDSAAKAIHMLPIKIGRGTKNVVKGWDSFRYMGQDFEIQRDYAFG